MSSLDLVRKYFDREAERFDAIYDSEKPLHERIVDQLFRSVVVERHKLIVNLAPTGGDWSVLDIGCGSGRYAIALAQAGASRIVGVDIAASMIELARKAAAEAELNDRCEFLHSSFLDFETDEGFDVLVATGYFDYIEHPLSHVAKMLGMCRGRIFASFPKRWEYRVPIRKLRFALENGYVRFYSRADVEDLFRRAGLARDSLSLIDLGRDLIAVARVG